MRPRSFLLAGLSFLLLAAEARAQSLSSPEMTRIRLALAALVALLLFLSIKRGVPARGSRRWFWEAGADELGPELARLRQWASLHVMAGASLLIGTVIFGGYLVSEALVDAFETGGTFLDHLARPPLLLAGVVLATGIGLLLRGLRMAPKEPPSGAGPG